MVTAPDTIAGGPPGAIAAVSNCYCRAIVDPDAASPTGLACGAPCHVDSGAMVIKEEHRVEYAIGRTRNRFQSPLPPAANVHQEAGMTHTALAHRRIIWLAGIASGLAVVLASMPTPGVSDATAHDSARAVSAHATTLDGADPVTTDGPPWPWG
jgi:hypothetical protein